MSMKILCIHHENRQEAILNWTGLAFPSFDYLPKINGKSSLPAAKKGSNMFCTEADQVLCCATIKMTQKHNDTLLNHKHVAANN